MGASVSTRVGMSRLLFAISVVWVLITARCLLPEDLEARGKWLYPTRAAPWFYATGAEAWSGG